MHVFLRKNRNRLAASLREIVSADVDLRMEETAPMVDMEVLDTFLAKLTSGVMVTVHHIQKYVEVNGATVRDGTAYILHSGEAVLQMSVDSFVVLYPDRLHRFATRVASPNPVSAKGE